MSKIIFYTDGSYNKKNSKVYGWASYIIDESDLKTSISGTGHEFIESWQIGGECEAVLQSLKYFLKNNLFKKYKTIEIRYDYLGVEKWATGEWKRNKNVSKNYAKQFKELKLYCLAHNVNITFTKVKGHSGILGNDIADDLAKKAIAEYEYFKEKNF